MEQTAEQLNAKIRAKYNALDEAGAVCISPSDLADAVIKEIDQENKSPVLVTIAAILELRQLARGICRQRQSDSERDSEQSGLFEFQLQERYPAHRGEVVAGERDEVYVLRNHLTVAERRKNVNRLRREASAKIAHADALEAETEHLIRAGRLKEQTVTA